MVTMVNDTARVISFKISGLPGDPILRYSVPPGGTCEVPDEYAESPILTRIAKGLVPHKGNGARGPVLPAPLTPLSGPISVGVDSTEMDTLEDKPRAKKRKG